MPRKAQPWFRWYVEAFGDRKLRRLTPAQRWLFVAMCGAGKESPELGRLLVAPGLPMTDAEVAEYADVPVRDVVKALPLMDALGMVRRDPDGTLVVLNLQHRQYASDSSKDRTADYRDRKVADDPDDVVTSQRRHKDRHSDGRSDVPDTETETETEDTPPSLRSGAPRERTPTGTFLPEDWQPTARDVAWLRDEYPWITTDQGRELTAGFVDYWTSGGKTARYRKLDWSKTWRNRVRDQAHRYKPRQTSTLFGPGPAVTDDDHAWALEQDRLLEVERARMLAEDRQLDPTTGAGAR